MPIEALGFLAYVHDLGGSLTDQVFCLLHGKGVVTVDDEDVSGPAFLARRDAILSWSARRELREALDQDKIVIAEPPTSASTRVPSASMYASVSAVSIFRPRPERDARGVPKQRSDRPEATKGPLSSGSTAMLRFVGCAAGERVEHGDRSNLNPVRRSPGAAELQVEPSQRRTNAAPCASDEPRRLGNVSRDQKVETAAVPRTAAADSISRRCSGY